MRSIVDPNYNLHHEHWRREVCRHLGYGFVDPEDAIACAADRATMWATGTLGREASLTLDIPVPHALSANANLREVRATLAWFTPIRPGHLAYRAVKLKIASLQPEFMRIVGSGPRPLNRRIVNPRVGQLYIADGVTSAPLTLQARLQFLCKSNGSEIRVHRLMKLFLLVSL